jgi:hypothetical protein
MTPVESGMTALCHHNSYPAGAGVTGSRGGGDRRNGVPGEPPARVTPARILAGRDLAG